MHVEHFFEEGSNRWEKKLILYLKMHRNVCDDSTHALALHCWCRQSEKERQAKQLKSPSCCFVGEVGKITADQTTLKLTFYRV